MSRTPPQGELRDHDHSRPGEGGDEINPDAIGLTGDEPFNFGDVEVEFRPAVGSDGALVFRDTANDEDRFFIEIGDVVRFANQAVRMPDGLKLFLGTDEDYSMAFDTAVGANGAVVFRDEENDQDRLEMRVGDVFRLLGHGLDVNGNDIEDSGTTIWDSANGEVPNAAVEALVNFAANEVFSEYPISLGGDTDRDADGNDIDNIGGTPAAAAGALRLANTAALNWRSSEDDGDFGWRLTATEAMVYAAAGTDRASFAENGNLSIEGSLTEGASL